MRLIDADALIHALETQDYSGSPESLKDWTPQDMTKAEIADINNAPTIDAVEVIRCEDCKHRLHLGPTEHYPETYVCRIDNVSGTRKAYRDEWFCADGERRTDENDN